MVDLSVYAFSPPSPSCRHFENTEDSKPQSKAGQGGATTAFLVPSQVILSASNQKDVVDVHDLSTNQTDYNAPKERGSRKEKENQQLEAPASSATNKSVKQTKRRRSQRFGNFPDIYWRSISMDHLRQHPQFDALPERVASIDTLEDVKSFRQDSWQWDVLHRGRCTTSQASAALGFLEPHAATALFIPKSWQRGGLGAYYRLRDDEEGALQSLEEMRRILLETDDDDDDELIEEDSPSPSSSRTKQIWSQATLSPNYPFSAKYLVRMTPAIRKLRKQHVSQKVSTLSTKMSWGNAQEATSMLTALNYFWKTDPDVRLEEVGMCGAGLFTSNEEDHTNHMYPNLPPLGASPDALIIHSNGTREVLEVKNHCPFYTTKQGRKNSPNQDFAIKSFPFSAPHLPPLYVPQMMMEMLCSVDCESAVMVRQTATTGALILRLQRDDDWINEMLYWLEQFQTRYVEAGIPPASNFFWKDEEGNKNERYQEFVQHTKDVANSVEILHHVPHKEIQRMQGIGPNTTSLFLD
jgi:hypothetical protein